MLPLRLVCFVVVSLQIHLVVTKLHIYAFVKLYVAEDYIIARPLI